MASPPQVWNDGRSSAVEDFSLVLGGPLFQLLRRSHLTNDAEGLLLRRIIVISLFAWLPLMLIAAGSKALIGGPVAVPFLHDLEVHVRFLVATPLFIAAELLVHLRIRPVVAQFLERGLIPEAAIPQFNAAIAEAMSLRNSKLAEALLIAAVYAFGIFIWRRFVVLDTDTWYATRAPAGLQLTPAGWWYAFVSLPVFQFLLLRWYFRMFIWTRFLWRVSRIQLLVLPTHSDRLGGMAFLAGVFYAFMPLALAHGSMLAGMLANRIFYHGAMLTDFKPELALMVLWLQFLVFGPLLVFAPQLARAKREANRRYGTLVMRHNREFAEKWLDDAGESPLGNADMSSLIDLGSSFETVRSMRAVLVTRDSVLFLAAATAAPILPLALTLMSLEELLRKLAGLLL